jgi:PiT family inorganic phosphate transporter
MNGFHDAANSIATVVSTGVLKPTQAVACSPRSSTSSRSSSSPQVAATVGKGIVLPGVVDTPRGVRRAGGRHYLERA